MYLVGNLGYDFRMKTVFLAGGHGTRIREETEIKPKPMIEVGGKPLLWHLMKYYASYGFEDFIICAGYKKDFISNWLANYQVLNSDFTVKIGHELNFHSNIGESNWSVTLADTGLDTMTGGRLKLVEKYVGGETFFCTYGDGLSNVDLDALMAFHRSHGKLATVTTVKPLSRFGVIEVGADGHVEAFKEKPQTMDWVNGGFFVFEPKIFSYLNIESILEQEPLKQLAEAGELMAFQHDGFWQPMDTFREYTILNQMWNSNNAAWKRW